MSPILLIGIVALVFTCGFGSAFVAERIARRRQEDRDCARVAKAIQSLPAIEPPPGWMEKVWERIRTEEAKKQ